MKMTGAKDLVIEQAKSGPVLRIMVTFDTKEQAAAAYDMVSEAAKTGELRLNLMTGDIIKEH